MFLTEKTPSAKKSSKIKAFSHSKKYFCEYLTRADDLGRVVVPKELRRTMKISEGTPLEIFIDKDGSIIFRKYSPVGELNEKRQKHGGVHLGGKPASAPPCATATASSQRQVSRKRICWISLSPNNWMS